MSVTTSRINGHPVIDVSYSIAFIRGVKDVPNDTEVNLWEDRRCWYNDVEPDVSWLSRSDALSAAINTLQNASQTVEHSYDRVRSEILKYDNTTYAGYSCLVGNFKSKEELTLIAINPDDDRDSYEVISLRKRPEVDIVIPEGNWSELSTLADNIVRSSRNNVQI